MRVDSNSRQKVFLSYSRKDTPFCDRLFRDLSTLDVDVMRDEETLTLGSPLKKEIRKCLDSVDFVIFLLSRKSLASAWVLWEIKPTIETSDLPDAKPKLIPVALDADFLDDGTIDEISLQLQSQRDALAEMLYKRSIKNLTADHLETKKSFLDDALKQLPVIMDYLRSQLVLNVDRRDYDKAFAKLSQAILGQECKPTHFQATQNTDFESRMKSIKTYLFRGGDASERQEALHEAAISVLQCVEDYLPDDVELRVRATTLCAKLRNAYSELTGRERLSEINEVVHQIILILHVDLIRP